MIGGPKQIEIAEAIVAHFKGDLHLLFQASVVELVSISGVGEATAARIKSALALSRRLSMTSMDRVTVNSPGDAAALCSDMSTFDVEHLRVIMLNTKSMVLGHCGCVQRFGQLIADSSGRGLSSCAATQCAKYCDCPQSSERGRRFPALMILQLQGYWFRLASYSTLRCLTISSKVMEICSLKEKGLGFS